MLVNTISSREGLVNKYGKEYNMAIHLVLPLLFLPSLECSYLTFLQHPNEQKTNKSYKKRPCIYIVYVSYMIV